MIFHKEGVGQIRKNVKTVEIVLWKTLSRLTLLYVKSPGFAYRRTLTLFNNVSAGNFIMNGIGYEVTWNKVGDEKQWGMVAINQSIFMATAVSMENQGICSLKNLTGLPP